MQLKIGVKEPFVPKSDLRYDEFLSIKQTFSHYDFQNNFKGIQMGIFAHFGIIFIGKFLKRGRWL